MRKLLLLLLITIFFLQGCAYMANQRRAKLTQLEIGMTKQKVIDIMGQPHKTEAYQQPNGKNLEYLIYITRYEYPFEEHTPIAIYDGKVVGWGNSFKESQQQRYEIEIKNR